MKQLFVDTKDKNWNKNSCLGDRFSTNYSYALGYLNAANILVDYAISNPNNIKDKLVYPVCFNYRQFIELTLKQLIIYAEKFYSKSEYLGYEYKKTTTLHSDRLMSTHSLEKLLKWLIEILACVAEYEFEQSKIDLVIEFHNIDPDGQKFRYPIQRNNDLSFPNQIFLDLERLKEGVKSISEYFMGIDGYIDYYDSMADSIISSLDLSV